MKTLCEKITLTFKASERLASSLSMFPAAVATSCVALFSSMLKRALCVSYIWDNHKRKRLGHTWEKLHKSGQIHMPLLRVTTSGWNMKKKTQIRKHPIIPFLCFKIFSTHWLVQWHLRQRALVCISGHILFFTRSHWPKYNKKKEKGIWLNCDGGYARRPFTLLWNMLQQKI